MEAGPDKKGESVEFVMYAYMQINKREGKRRERERERRRSGGERGEEERGRLLPLNMLFAPTSEYKYV